MNLSQWESLPDEEILTLRAEIAGVARAHMMPPLPVPVDMVKNLKCIEKAWFPSRNFLAQPFLKPQEHVNPGSTIKFREALE